MFEEIYTKFLNTEIGYLKICSDRYTIQSISFDDESGRCSKIVPDVLTLCYELLMRYFEGNIVSFERLTVEQNGTDFQQKVWNIVKAIPFGKTISYGQIAEQLGEPKLARAVGNANSKNRLLIIVPCHRVTANDGSLTGYAFGLNRKRWLLNHEQNYFQPKLL